MATVEERLATIERDLHGIRELLEQRIETIERDQRGLENRLWAIAMLLFAALTGVAVKVWFASAVVTATKGVLP